MAAVITSGALVRSKTKLASAKVVSIKGDVVCLNFGWDSRRARFWWCSVAHLEKHYVLR